MENRKTDKYRLKKTIKYLNTVKAIFFITFVINVLLFAYKHESKVEHANYKILVQETEGSDNYVEYEGSAFPTSGYLFDSYECANDGVITQNPSTLKLSFSGGVDQCTLKYRINATGSSVETLELLQALNPNIIVNSGEPDFTQKATTDEGLYRTRDDYGYSFYFRGASVNNYVKFGKNTSNQDLYWRIVRINGDGSIRLFYAGTSATAKESIGTSQFNSSSNSNAYVGYMYGNSSSSATYEQTHANTNSSAVKTTLDNWYINNIKNKSYEKYVSDTVFCNDRTTTSGTGQGTDTSYYSARTRVNDNKDPILTCTQKNDAFTVNDTDVGNGALSYSVGLLSLDEAAMAGLVYGVLYSNSNSYLHKGFNYWLLSPAHYRTGEADNANVNSTGSLGSDDVNQSSMNVVPVINLTHDAVKEFIGTGTSTDPFSIPTYLEDGHCTFETDSSGGGGNANMSGLTLMMKNASQGEDDESWFTDSAANQGQAGVYTRKGTNNDAYPIYYYRGAYGEVNNNLIFNNYCWKIVRTTATGSVRILYNGPSVNNTCPNQTGDSTMIGKYPFNESDNDAKYVGYRYDNNGTMTDSNLKITLDTWYTANMSRVDSKVETSTYCNDTTTLEDEDFEDLGVTPKEGSVYYCPYYRVKKGQPTTKCKQASDEYSGKVGFLTVDEEILAGRSATSGMQDYLYNSSYYWLGSPYYFDGGFAFVFRVGNVNSAGYGGYVNGSFGVRPVVSLSPNTSYTGSGTTTDPFIVN